MNQCGFTGVDVAQASLPAQIESAEAFSRGLVLGNPLYQEMVDRGGDPDAVRTALETVIRDESGTEISLGVVVAQGAKGAASSQ